MYLKKTGLNTSTIYMKCLGMSPLLPSCKFVRKPTEEPLDSSIKGMLIRDTHKAEDYREHTQDYTTQQWNLHQWAQWLPPGNVPDCLWVHGQIHSFVSPLYPREANKPEYG